MRAIPLLLPMAALFATTAAHAAMPITVSLETEKPGIQDSTSGFKSVGVERFDKMSTGKGQTVKTDFGSSGVFTGVYTGLQVNEKDKFGGAGGIGQYAVTFTKAGYSLDLSSTLKSGVTYFGFWLSALDRGNNVTFYQKGKQLFTFTAADAKTFIDGLTDDKGLSVSKTYYGNPNKAYKGQNSGEPYAFLNFYASYGTSFDKIVFTENPLGGGYESDNHTVGQWNKKSGTIIPTGGIVPEPQTWALLIAGFSMVGLSLRRNRRSGAIAA